MAKIIVFHYTDKGKLPKLSDKERQEIVNKIYEELKNYPDVKFNGTFVNRAGKGICEWDAPNAKVVNEIIKKVLGEPPVDGAYLVNRVL